ncbi:GTP-binding protein [Aquimarina algicola]|uniref:GTP-binding protein n=1 Tax=Aquimarina algicola TaxID=2589995 RepID=A0A504JM99_9FLAO|nr:GTP-binding protein [Aquimarina algicola]TPN87811.1 GTP-binding protein [Aquimarina algicola]
MKLSNDIVLRPRFFEDLDIPAEKLLDAFEEEGRSNKKFSITRIDHHVFIRFPKHKQSFWSPQLHLEIYQYPNEPTKLKGLFGPSPTVWTLFMFLHFMVATSFIGALIWLYVNISLQKSYFFAVVTLISLFIAWFVLYFAGRLGKESNKNEMFILHYFMKDTIQAIK